ncbi:MAG: HEPN domain-containing protein [Candidatus Scalindua sp. AMX11]|nr:MAG: HEPN domain-containing protein [Candidatus Scalindua sp.]NOG83171.1 HEPN domain-containing protein [Planctomycetota bacterium]RZV77539.1 MAG: HEPN domain-containing protein [Candidatus Scalindua sp. SCAELEC01]TDE64582.1 MAG: HEPN domain-containing protein [Candidatus Scalindua sp. AMX11]
MVDSQLIEEWIKKADEDMGFASSVVEESTYYAQICFHYQQAAEKYLKAFIIAYVVSSTTSYTHLSATSCVTTSYTLNKTVQYEFCFLPIP